MNQPSAMKTWYFREYLAAWLWCAAIVVLTQLPMLSGRHDEGDEMVYYVLAERMGWDLSNYTTRDDPRVNDFPYSIYRQPLFHHPPLYPLALKATARLFQGGPLSEWLDPATASTNEDEQGVYVAQTVVAGAFLVAVFLRIAAVVYMWRLMTLLKVEPMWGTSAMVLLTCCPLILFSSVRIHHDGLAGLALLIGLIAFIEATLGNRRKVAVEAAVWLTAAFNLRFNALVALPIVVFLPLYLCCSADVRKPEAASKSKMAGVLAALGERRLVIGIVWVAVATVGLQHFYRVYFTYGTIRPESLIVMDPGALEFSPFLKMLYEKVTRGRTLWELGVIFPLLILVAAPWNVRFLVQAFLRAAVPAGLIAATILMFAVHFLMNHNPQLRYFAFITPLMHACWPFLLSTTPSAGGGRAHMFGLAGVTLFLMITTAFFNSVMVPANAALIVPSVCFYWPSWLQEYL